MEGVAPPYSGTLSCTSKSKTQLKFSLFWHRLSSPVCCSPCASERGACPPNPPPCVLAPGCPLGLHHCCHRGSHCSPCAAGCAVGSPPEFSTCQTGDSGHIEGHRCTALHPAKVGCHNASC